jgi:hypothetical protein
VKHLWGYRKVRYRGIDKNAAPGIYFVYPGQSLSRQKRAGDMIGLVRPKLGTYGKTE